MATTIQSDLITIAHSVKALFLEGYNKSSKEVKFKGQIDLVTQYDLNIETMLTQKLKEAYPEYMIVGEEHTDQVQFPVKAIYVDPIDGTTNFVHGIPFCAISIGLWERGVPTEGVVYNPVLDETYYAKKGEGAFLNGEPIQVTQTENIQNSLIATGFPYTKFEKGRDYEWVIESMQAILPISRDIRRLGSASLDLCMVAKGVFDAYYEVNLKPWDVAAGILIVTEAGGKISNELNKTYTLSHRAIVASNSYVHDELCTHFKRL